MKSVDLLWHLIFTYTLSLGELNEPFCEYEDFFIQITAIFEGSLSLLILDILLFSAYLFNFYYFVFKVHTYL